MEIGGFIGLDEFHNEIPHENAVMLNTARNCLVYLIRTKKIKKILLPRFLCGSVQSVCEKEKIDISYYSIDSEFKPNVTNLKQDQWLYVVNYYGFIDNKYLSELKKKFDRVIIDNVHAFFQKPIDGVDTIYGCRKFFGVSDGAFLYTDKKYESELEYDISYDRIRPRLGRYESDAEHFFAEYKSKEKEFVSLDLKMMSKLTYNLLHAIDYPSVIRVRRDNYEFLNNKLCKINQLNIANIPEVPFMYPLLLNEDCDKIRKRMAEEKIYIPVLWPEVLNFSTEKDIEYRFARNILPLPIDQRYGKEHMNIIIDKIMSCIYA